MEKRTHDRRRFSDADRRSSYEIVLPKVEEGLKASVEMLSLARSEAISEYERSVTLRENAVVVREQAIKEREEDLLRREELLRLSQRKSSALRIQEISDAQITKATQDYRQSKLKEANQHMVIASMQNQTDTDEIDQLKEANEHLVIASLQNQIKTDEIEMSKIALSHLANHDFLTNLPNRLQLVERITQAIAVAKQHGDKLAVLFLDLDRFKAVNDQFGHAVGDQLLQAVAHRLNNAIRSSDTVSRQGGDEFVLVLSKVNHKATLVRTVKKIHTIITAPYTIAGIELHIGATIGISIFPQDGNDIETLIRNADDAMYYAKDSGRNRYQFFNEEIHSRGSVNIFQDIHQ